MTFVAIQTLQTKTTSYTSDTATSITVPNDALTLLSTELGPSANGNYTTVSVSDGFNTEIMFLLGVDGGAVTVQRGQEGSSAVPLASGATVRFVWTETSILAIAPGGSVTCAAAPGQATNVTGGPHYTISTPIVDVTAGPGLSIVGGYPSYHIVSTVPSGPPGPTGPAGPSTAVTGSGSASVTPITGGFNVDVPAGNLIAGSGIAISGTWPNITITNTQTPGGSGTVTSVSAGAGISITGTPAVNPTVALSPTGVVAGVYGALTVNTYGQITALGANFFTSLSTSTTGMTVANPTAGAWTVNAGTASTGTQGLIKLAPATSSGSNNSSDSTSAVTPAGVNAVVTGLNLAPASFTVSGSQVALASGSYTNTIIGLPISLTVAAGKSALINIYVEVYDSASTTTPQNFGIGLFNGGSLLAGVSDTVPGSVRTLQYLVTGPLTAALTVKTTALTGTQTLGSYYATVTAN